MEKPLSERGLSSELAVFALVAAAALPLGRLFRTSGPVLLAVAAAAAGTAVAWGLRRLRVPLPLSPFVSLAVLGWAAGAWLHPDTLAGPLPTLETARALGDMIAEAARASTTEVAPVVASDGFMLLVAAGVWVTAWVVDDAVGHLRRPLLGIALSLPLFLVPGTILESAGNRFAEVGPYLVAAIALLLADETQRLGRWGTRVGGERRAAGSALRLGGVTVLAALVLAPVIPGYGDPPIFRSSRGGARVAFNPLVDIKPALNRTPTLDLLYVQSPAPVYLRLTALDRFNGRFWTARPETADLDVAGRAADPHVAGAPARVVRTRVQVEALGGPWLPAPYEPIQVDGVQSVSMQESNRALVLASDLGRGSVYEVVSRLPAPGIADLDRPFTAEDFNADGLGRFLALPATPSELTVIARRITEGADTPYRRALALQRHLRSFTYDENVAAGHDYADVLSFLEVRRGYCEQFAGTMAVLARLLGIPARVAVGFGVGVPTGPDTYTITTRQAHAWVEIFLPTTGWLAFEPTPRAGVAHVPSYTEAANPLPSPTAAPTSAPTVAPTTGPTAAPTQSEAPRPGGSSRGLALPVALPVTGVVLAALILAALPGARSVVRARRRKAATARRARATLEYQEFLTWCSTVRLGRSRAETPAEHALRLEGLATQGRGAAEQLASLAEAALWSQDAVPDPGEVRRLARATREAVSPSVPRRRRALAAAGWGWWKR